ncbi:glyceraldehyde 3-phosphate dehydrogenase, NAD binding domain protein, partial [Vibrio parahaemolyticus VPTS-2010_2]
CRY